MTERRPSLQAQGPDLAADVVIVGAGPAGLAAAHAAAEAGLDVLVLDAAPAAGGQIWRARRGVAAAPVARALARLAQAGGRVLAGTRVVMPLPAQTLLVDGLHGACRLRWQRLVIATGARERLLPFPGWTLPGVFGAGGLQALVKGGWPIAGRRVLVAGSGPLLLAAAATLRREGARVVGLVEEATGPALARLAGALAWHPRQGLDALRLGRALLGAPFHSGTRIVAAEGNGRLERVTLAPVGGAARGAPHAIACDALAVGWGLVPQTELAQALGCAIAQRFGADAIVVDARQRTSVGGVFAIGECTGVAGVRAARLQGLVAGAAAAGELAAAGGARRFGLGAADSPRGLRRTETRLAREFAFAERLARTFERPAHWATRLRDDTIVCRCEDVAWADVRACADLRSAKLATRCGMGHCQGRLCHDSLSDLSGWARLPVHPPLLPTALATLLAAACDHPTLAPEETPR